MENHAQPSTTPQVSKQNVWERKLLDLSLRNPLVNLRLTRSILPLLTPNVAELEDRLADKCDFSLCPIPEAWRDTFEEKALYHPINTESEQGRTLIRKFTSKELYVPFTGEILDKSVVYLYRAARASLQENGANSLFVALGLLAWYETPSADESRYAPIVLVPVDLVRKPARQGYLLRPRDEDPMINITLLEKLRQDFQITVEGLDPLPHDDHGLDLPLIFRTLRDAVQGMPRWELCEHALLGLFSFSKFVMWNDIHHNASLLARNLVVKSLLAQANVGISSLTEVVDPDATYDPSDVALPVPADAYQLRAVLAAGEGKSFVLHGPPGTGKSQTITNIIANALYQGKRVLFVAEKMAALSVVQQRLNRLGLEPFCLELFSHKSSKSEVLAQFRAVLEMEQTPHQPTYAQQAARLRRLRSGLAGFAKEMHQPLPSGLSLYDLMARYDSLRNTGVAPVDSLSFPASFSSLTQTDWADLGEWLSRTETALRLCGNLAEHPLRAIAQVDYTPVFEEELRHALASLLSQLPDVSPRVTAEVKALLGETYVLKTREQFAAWSDLLTLLASGQPILARLVVEQDTASAVERLRALLEHALEMQQWGKTIMRNYDPELLQQDFRKLERSYRYTTASFFLTRLVVKRKLRKRLERYHLLHRVEAEQLPALFEQLRNYHTERATLLSETVLLTSLFRHADWLAYDYDWVLVKTSFETTVRFIQCLKILAEGEDEWALRKRVIRHWGMLSGDGQRDVPAWSASLVEVLPIRQAIDLVDSLLPPPELPPLPYLEALGALYTPIFEGLPLLRDWAHWLQCAAELATRGLGDLVRHLVKGLVPTERLKDTVLISLYAYLIRYLVSAAPHLSHFNSHLFEEEIALFRKRSQEFELLTQRELRARLGAKLADVLQDPTYAPELGFLQRKVLSNGRGTPLRKFFEGIPNLLQRLKPCMLMSPISVAQYLDLALPPFDLLIFDEASQLPTGEAVGAMARAKEVVVVGDPKQMPPTAFFATSKEDEENLELEDLESILDDTLAIPLPSLYLRGHYRSKHESLIAFSNAHFYDSQLLTFPSPDDRKSQVFLHPIEGVYDRGKSRTNEREAQAVVNAVLEHLKNPMRRQHSLGIVTFSVPQQTVVEDLLADAFAAHPDLEALDAQSDEPVFVKNLENVQGDERDIILFSIGYGPDADGNLSHNFGPLNQKGGWRRLNVAITRARYEMHIFTTLHYAQIDPKRSSALGVQALRDFLEFAEKGTPFRQSAPQREEVSPDLIYLVAEALRARGHQVDTHVGASMFTVDLAIVDPANPSHYLLGILCDGASYQAAPTVGDREVIRPQALHALGWRLFRLWALDWFYRREETLTKIEDALALGSESRSLQAI